MFEVMKMNAFVRLKCAEMLGVLLASVSSHFFLPVAPASPRGALALQRPPWTAKMAAATEPRVPALQPVVQL